MKKALLPERRSSEDEESGSASLMSYWEVLMQEGTRLGYIAGPMVAVTLSLGLINVISMMMVGHLGELALSSSAVAISLSNVTGFSLLVSSFSVCTIIFVVVVVLLILVHAGHIFNTCLITIIHVLKHFFFL